MENQILYFANGYMGQIHEVMFKGMDGNYSILDFGYREEKIYNHDDHCKIFNTFAEADIFCKKYKEIKINNLKKSIEHCLNKPVTLTKYIK